MADVAIDAPGVFSSGDIHTTWEGCFGINKVGEKKGGG
jgi:hypothetical protein